MTRSFRALSLLLILSIGTLAVAGAEIDADLSHLNPDLAADIQKMRDHVELELPKETDPGNRAKLIGQLAIIYHAQLMLEAAEESYLEALSHAEDYAYRYLLAIIVLQRGDTDTAIAHLEQVVLSNPEYVPAWYRLGTLLLLKGNLEEAKGSLENAQKIYPSSAAILVALADVRIAQESFELAIELLEKAWIYEPNNGQIAYKLLQAYRQLGDEESVEYWTAHASESVQPPSLTDPLLVELAGLSQSARFFAQAANWAFNRGDQDAVREALSQATKLAPDNLEYAIKYATFLELVGEIDEAATELKRYLSVDDTSSTAWYSIARLYRQSQDGEEFLQGLMAANRAAELEKDNDAYRTLAAAMSMQAALYAYAQEHYMQLLERNPDNAYFYYWFGVSRLAENQCDGREAIRRAIALRKNWGEAHVLLARADAHCGDIEAANRRLEALSRAAADKDIQAAQAFVSLLSGDTDQALLLAEDLLPDPDAVAIVSAAEEGKTPDRLFADASRWWVPPELLN